jgi:hypothetical protein
MAKSDALAGTSIRPKVQQVSYNSPEDQVTPPQTPNKPVFNGLINIKDTTKDANSNR